MISKWKLPDWMISTIVGCLIAFSAWSFKEWTDYREYRTQQEIQLAQLRTLPDRVTSLDAWRMVTEADRFRRGDAALMDDKLDQEWQVKFSKIEGLLYKQNDTLMAIRDDVIILKQKGM